MLFFVALCDIVAKDNIKSLFFVKFLVDAGGVDKFYKRITVLIGEKMIKSSKKFFLTTLLLLSAIFASVSYADDNIDNEESSADYSMASRNMEEENIAFLLNLIQFSVAKIIVSENKGFLTYEQESIMNNYERSELVDAKIINEYKYLFEGITQLVIRGEKRQFLDKKIQFKKDNAIYNSLNSFGSVLVAPSPVGIAYAVLNAGFNYARTTSEINMEKMEEDFQLKIDNIKNIDELRGSLFSTSALVYMEKKYHSQYLITETSMKDLAKAAFAVDTTDDPSVLKANLVLLEDMIHDASMSKFSPLWLTLGKVYFKLNEYEKAESSFNKVCTMKSSVLRHNPYIAEAARYILTIRMKNNQYLDLEKYESLIDKNTPPGVRDDLYRFLASVYIFNEDWDSAKKYVEYLKSRNVEAEYGVLASTVDLHFYPENSIEYRRAEAIFRSKGLIWGITPESDKYIELEDEYLPYIYFLSPRLVKRVYLNSNEVDSLTVSEADPYNIVSLKNSLWHKYMSESFSASVEFDDGIRISYRKSKDEDVTDDYIVRKVKYKRKKHLSWENWEARLIRMVITKVSIMENGEWVSFEPNTKTKKWVRLK